MAASALTADTSVIVPALVRWHSLHAPAAAALRGVRRVPAHALVESFSVLTRLPGGRALGPPMAHRLLVTAFPGEPLSLAAVTLVAVLHRLAVGGVGGGRVYDAIVGATAAEAGARLLTADRRALPTYALVGSQFDLVQ